MNRQNLANTSKVLSAFGAAAAGAAATQQADAAVVAQSVDVTVPPTFVVDLNADGTKEFDIIDLGGLPDDMETIVKVYNMEEGVGVVLDDSVPTFTSNLAEGTLIGPLLSFGVPADDALNGDDGSGPVGNFQPGDPAGYIGVQFPIAGNLHYGYVGFEGVEVDEANKGAEGRVFAFGYDDAPNTPIAAGAGLSGGPDADFDADGDVDGQDFLIWQRGVGLTGQTDNANGDADASGAVDGADLEAWETAFGAGGASAPAVGAVPEPTSLSLLAAGAAGVAAYRRRRTR